MSRTCNCCGAALPAGRVVELAEIEHELPHARMTLYKYKRRDRDGRGLEWLFKAKTQRGNRLMVDLELAARWYREKWPLVAARLQQVATQSQSISKEVAGR